MSRVEIWLLRNRYPAGLVALAALTAWSLASSDGPKDFLVGRYSTGRLPWYALLTLLVLPAHVAVHELGHAAAGALLGIRFERLQVGWLSVTREGGRYRVAWKRTALAGALGFHKGVPIGPGFLGARMAAVAAAGPVVSFLAALACRAGAEALGSPAVAGQAVASHLLRVALWVGLALAVSNLVPFRTKKGTMSDGAIVLRGLRTMFSPAGTAVLRFHALWAEGRRPREWGIPAKRFLEVAAGATSERDALLLAALAVALDSGDEGLAADIIGGALASPTPPHHDSSMRYEIELQAVMVEAFQGRSGAARERLVRAGRPQGFSEYVRLAEAVVDAAEGRLVEARAGLEAWERARAASGRAESILVGNQWAVEKLRARLAPNGPDGP